MSKTEKRISINELEKIATENYIPTKTVEWNGVEIIIKNTLSLHEVIDFVDGVATSCFKQETGAYMPEVKDFAIKCCIMQLYANFRLPSNVETRYDLVYRTDAVDVIVQYINKVQLEEIVDAINDKIDNIAQANIEMVNIQMNELYTSFNNLQEQMNSIFSGIKEDDMAKLLGAMSEGKLDEEKLVQAYMQSKKDGE